MNISIVHKLFKTNIEELWGCCKLYTTVGVTKLPGRFSKKELIECC